MRETLPTPDKKGVLFMPLGGCGQFGANFAIYGFDGDWIAVDCGMAFADERLPGVDVVLPDASLIEAQKACLKGLFVTHAHEDHIGAIAWLWPKLRCPIYATPFAAAVLRRKLDEHVYHGQQPIVSVVQPGGSTQAGAFKVTHMPVGHSIPEGNALCIETQLGRIVHTGDWCMDPAPILGVKTEPEMFKALGDKGVLAYVGDSTSAETPKRDVFERDVEDALTAQIDKAPRKVAITMFASNVGRIISIHRAAQRAGRKVALVGRSLDNMVKCAREVGLMDEGMRFVSARDAKDIPDHKIVLILTGSQGEGRAALARVARGTHPDVKLKPDDVLIFSSRAIPGNEMAINDIKNALLENGVNIVTERDGNVHVSGHPAREYVSDMIGWLRPTNALCVHGERMQTHAHANLARAQGVAHVCEPDNGELYRIGTDGVQSLKVYNLHFGAVDMGRVVKADALPILERRKMSFNGAVFVSLSVDRQDGGLLDLQLSAMGLLDGDDTTDERALTDLEDKVAERFEMLGRADKLSEDEVENTVRSCVRRYFRDKFDMKPLVAVHIALV